MSDASFSQPLSFYRGGSYPCSYLPGKSTTSVIATPLHVIDSLCYSQLARQGFRRNGFVVYRPDCEVCRECVPVRLPVHRFLPDRTQKRCLKRHQNLRIRERHLDYYEEHFKLYQRYQKVRHPDDSMNFNNNRQYADFLLNTLVDTRLFEFLEGDTVRMVSLIDVVEDGLSAVYTFFDPDMPKASYGTYSILWLIAQCIASRLSYAYLGYWIRDCRKMAYKVNFRPVEYLTEGCWQELKR